MGDPKVCVVSWTSEDFDIWRQFELLTERTWFLGTTQFPGGQVLKFSVTADNKSLDW